jgi:putative membrane protein
VTVSLLASNLWHFGEATPPAIAFLVYLLLYFKRAGTLAREQRPVEGWRIACFVSGVVLLTGVQVGPLDELADDVLVAHMAQHLILGDVASFLMVLGITGPVIAPLMHFRPTRPLRILCSPIPALVLWAVNLYAWHTSFAYQQAIRHDLVHAGEHLCFFWFGLLLWMALIGPLPKPAWFTLGWGKVLYVIGVRFIGSVLANILIWAQTVFYPVYKPTDAARGLNPLSDQNLAGGLMMVEEIILTTLILAWVFWRFAMQDEERQALLDFADEHGVVLSEDRAARAAAAGSGARLRERMLAGAHELPEEENLTPQ